MQEKRKKDGACVLYVNGWMPWRNEDRALLFQSVDDWLTLYSILPPDEKCGWKNGFELPSGKWILFYPEGERIGDNGLYWEFASLLSGEYLKEYLSERAQEM